MEPTAIARKLEILKAEGADMLASGIPSVTVNSVDEIDQKWDAWVAEHHQTQEVITLNASGSGNLLISKKVLEKVAFDPDYTFYEDYDFTIRATDMGFKLMETRNVIGFDINSDRPYSDLSVDMSVKNTLRGLRKKGIIQAQTITAGSASVGKGVAKFFLANKRYIFYVVHVPALVLLVVGAIFLNLWLVLIPLLYFLLYAAMHIRKRGFAKGASAFARSFTVGIPTTYATLYYCLKLVFKRPEKFTVKL
jgi:alanine-alpha-ketoisovalerate/valine-pyruvate aminotransferase